MQNQWSDEQVLSHLRWGGVPLIGEGSDARVFDIGGDRVLRLVRPGGQAGAQRTRAELLQKISAAHTAAAFRTPKVIDIFNVGGRVAVIEERLTGITLTETLKTTQGRSRDRLVCSYLDAAASIGDIQIHMPFWGDIFVPPGIRSTTYSEYLIEKLRSVQLVGGPLAELVMVEPGEMPDCSTPSLVHFDIFPDNVLAGSVSAIIDFGPSSRMADRRLDVWSAVAYLDHELSPLASEDDRGLALEWLRSEGLDSDYLSAKRWIASCWCFAHDDPAVRSWCRRVLSA
ncbi:aminoglycoside phosphotransferase family protein [Devosia sp. 1566]|uniref:phosphotransferase family protein n=1 Tax=Devosia sp. 1566 TaxID=2499144 RepID=UPI000FDBA312|nr:aminoglycoside phosphotransferase family protein [Devosia sp. 1566]